MELAVSLPGDKEYGVADIQPALNILRRSSAQWRVLRMDIPDNLSRGLVDHTCALPLLSTLYMGPNNRITKESTKAFSNAPHLTKL
jgi:hypothetical protein